MQFGIFTIGDLTTDPISGKTPTEAERIRNLTEIALKAEEVGLDVFATGEHHNPPFVPSSPTTHLAYIAAQTERLHLSTATTLITTNDPVKIAEDYAFLQHLANGRVDLMLGRGNTGPVYPWFGKDIQQGIPLAIENYHLLRRLWREPVVNWQGKFRAGLEGFTRWMEFRHLSGTALFVGRKSLNKPRTTAMASSTTISSGIRSTPLSWWISTAVALQAMDMAKRTKQSSDLVVKSSLAKPNKKLKTSSAPTSTTPQSMATGQASRTTRRRLH